ncbi:MAG: hypothetical protein IPJ78_19080 [Gemmatimonadetes bacterium]|nr:hypothetical protein [Gemmatimonadota bacterium]
MTAIVRDREPVMAGLRVGTALGLVFLVAVFTVLAPTPDLRARIDFLLDADGVGLNVVLVALLGSSGAAWLSTIGSLSFRSFAGVAVAAVAAVAVLTAGAVRRLVPMVEHVGARWLVLAGSLLIAHILIERRGKH